MEGPNLDEANGITIDSGVLPRAVDFIFKEIKRLELQNNYIEMQMSCMEIYNENLTDLLAVPESSNINGQAQGAANPVTGKEKGKDKKNDKDKENIEDNNSSLKINFAGGKVVVNGLTWVTIKENQQLFSLVSRASKTRVTDKTSWNEK